MPSRGTEHKRRMFRVSLALAGLVCVPAYALTKKDAVQADRAVRNQVSLELVQAVNKLNEARLHVYNAGDKAQAETLKTMAATAETFRQKVTGAPQYQQVIIKDWKGKGRALASRLIEFEEEMLRQSQVFSLACGRLLPEFDNADSPPPSPSPQAPAPERLAGILRRMERHFATRDSIFSGFSST